MSLVTDHHDLGDHHDHDDHDDHLDHADHPDHDAQCRFDLSELEVGGYLTKCARIAASIVLNDESRVS